MCLSAEEDGTAPSKLRAAAARSSSSSAGRSRRALLNVFDAAVAGVVSVSVAVVAVAVVVLLAFLLRWRSTRFCSMARRGFQVGEEEGVEGGSGSPRPTTFKSL